MFNLDMVAAAIAHANALANNNNLGVAAANAHANVLGDKFIEGMIKLGGVWIIVTFGKDIFMSLAQADSPIMYLVGVVVLVVAVSRSKGVFGHICTTFVGCGVGILIGSGIPQDFLYAVPFFSNDE